MEERKSFSSFDNFPLYFDMYAPEKGPSNEVRPAVVFAFGGGWMNGSVQQFSSQARALARIGIVSFIPYYRVYERDGTTFETAMRDYMCFLKYLSDNCGQMKIDPRNIVLAGASAGGQLVLSALLLGNIRWDMTVRGLILFNPVVDTSPDGYQSPACLNQQFDPQLFSPIHNLRRRLPPSLIFCGTQDSVIPYSRLLEFVSRVRKQGDQAELVTYPGRQHGFFNPWPQNCPEDYEDTLRRSLSFCRRCFSSCPGSSTAQQPHHKSSPLP